MKKWCSKKLALFDAWKVPKTKKTHNQRLMFYRAKTKMNGILWKIPKNNVKQVQYLRELQNIKEYDLINCKVCGYILHASTPPSLTYACPRA
jgi:rubrerythrin